MLEIIKAIVYGIVEGITEWLPISSTGHLILVEQLIPFTDVSEGNGPDVLVLNRSDLISFYNAGALSDLSTVLTNDTTEQIYPGVLDYGTIDGELVGITCEATINTLFVSNAVWDKERWNLQDVLGIIKSREETGDPIERVVAYDYSYVPHLMLSHLALMDITNSGFVNLLSLTSPKPNFTA